MGRKFGIVDGVRVMGRKGGFGTMGSMGDVWAGDEESGGGQELMDGGYLM